MAAERSTLPYRAPELFEVPSDCVIDEKVDIWVGYIQVVFTQVFFTRVFFNNYQHTLVS